MVSFSLTTVIGYSWQRRRKAAPLADIKSGDLGGTVGVIAGLAALALSLICAFCGARLAYLNAEQV